MKKEKDNRKLMRVYIKPDTEADIVEWDENQQNVGIAIKALIRMAIAVQGTKDILAMPFGINALTRESEQGREVPEKNSTPQIKLEKTIIDNNNAKMKEKNPDDGGLQNIRSAYYGNSDDMDMFGNL